MSYELKLIEDDDETRTIIGSYPDYPTALRARVEDTLKRLRRNGGWWTRVEHVIVGPGVDGPQTSHPFCTEFGVDRCGGRQPTKADFEDDRRWLMAAHELDLPDHAPR